MDHTLQNISATLGFCRKRSNVDVLLIGDGSMMYYIRPFTRYTIISPKMQSKKGCGLVTFSEARNIETKGLRWNMGKEHGLTDLEFGGRLSTSNEIVDEAVEVYSEGELFWVTTLKNQI